MLRQITILAALPLLGPSLAEAANLRSFRTSKVTAESPPLVHSDLVLSLEDVRRVCSPWSSFEYGECPKYNVTNLCEQLPGLCRDATYRRSEMPQLPDPPPSGSEADQGWSLWQQALGNAAISVKVGEHLPLRELLQYRPAQYEMDACVVCGVYFDSRKCIDGSPPVPSAEVCAARQDGCFCAWSSGMSLSEPDRHIVDGHHRWAGIMFLAADTDVLPGERRGAFLSQDSVVNIYGATIERLVSISRNVSSVEHSDAGEFGAEGS